MDARSSPRRWRPPPRLNGVAGPLLQFLASNDTSNCGTAGLQPRGSSNGSFRDFVACDSAVNCSGRGNPITFNAGNASAAACGNGGAPFAADGGFFGASGEPFVAARWVLSPVPEPGTLALLTVGGAWLGCKRRRAAAISG